MTTSQLILITSLCLAAFVGVAYLNCTFGSEICSSPHLAQSALLSMHGAVGRVR
jgi:hypothetical protein